MGNLKSAYELAQERIIAPKEDKRNDSPKPFMDFIDIPEFSDREDKMIESRETKSLQSEIDAIKVSRPEKVTFDGKPLEVCWNGHFLDYGGFARMNRAMAFGL